MAMLWDYVCTECDSVNYDIISDGQDELLLPCDTCGCNTYHHRMPGGVRPAARYRFADSLPVPRVFGGKHDNQGYGGAELRNEELDYTDSKQIYDYQRRSAEVAQSNTIKRKKAAARK